MGLLDYFRSKPKTASIARQRLELLIAHQHEGGAAPDYLPQMQQDIIEVIRKYVAVSDDAVQINFERTDQCDMLELNVSLGEDDAA
ncbi:MAG: cell division topological specificity factor MinE [Gammaproteobacteria bacterium]|nr:cell division topological specificity factor MinE [Gammaproteobacteria bacterium]